MMASGLPESIIVAKIKSSACGFDTTPKALKDLKAASVTILRFQQESAIMIMLKPNMGID